MDSEILKNGLKSNFLLQMVITNSAAKAALFVIAIVNVSLIVVWRINPEYDLKRSMKTI